MADKITLYDLPRKGRCASWSGNVWKTRLVLNYKKIPYQTEWIEHPQIAAKCQALGLQPNTTGPGSPYTVPVIIFSQSEGGEAIMDSLAIAEKLESLQPQPPLHLETGLQNQLAPILGKIGFALIPIFMPRVAREVLLDSSVPWFREARKKAFGMSLEDLEREKGGDKAWAAAQPGIGELGRFVREHKRDQGPFVLGSEVSYADFMIAAVLEGFRRIGEDIYQGLVEGAKELANLHEACRPWMIDDQ